MQVRLIKHYGKSFLGVIYKINNANYTNCESETEFIFPTIHKAKGREWKNVIVKDDFLIFSNNSSIFLILSQEQEELSLIYVAITRAMHNLDMYTGLHNFMKKLASEKEKLSTKSNNASLEQESIVIEAPLAVA